MEGHHTAPSQLSPRLADTIGYQRHPKFREVVFPFILDTTWYSILDSCNIIYIHSRDNFSPAIKVCYFYSSHSEETISCPSCFGQEYRQFFSIFFMYSNVKTGVLSIYSVSTRERFMMKDEINTEYLL